MEPVRFRRLAVPCSLPLILASGWGAPASVSADVTFHEHVAPIVLENCSGCHRPGEAAPFSLTTFDEVRKRAKFIRDVVEERYMPPWHAVRGAETFRDARVLTDSQVATIGAWVEAGMPEGDPAKAPAVPEWPEGWQLGEPDLVLEMDESFEVPAEGRDIYRYFALPVDLPEDKWVKAVEVRPSARSVVHHVLFFLDDTGKARELDADDDRPGFNGKGFSKTGDLGGWAVGTQPQFYPGGLALPMKKGSDLVLQTHFHPTGKAESEKTKVGLFFADKAPERSLVAFQVPPEYGSMAGIDVPPGDAEFVIEDSWVVPVDIELINVWGHAHQICRSMEGTATLPDGTVRPILHLPAWDFNWQTIYQYAEPERLPAGTRIDVRIVYDNSADNPANPFDPPQRIRWGEQSTDEMGSLIFQAVAAEEADVPVLAEAFGKQKRRAFVEASARRIGEEKFRGALAVISSADRDSDQRVSREELVEDWSDLAFKLLDEDKDGAIDRAELASGHEVAARVFERRRQG